MKIPAGLKKKVGPLPLGVWLVLGTAGGAVVYKKFSGGSSATPNANSSGNYYDGAGNLYDANGNLLAAAPSGGGSGDAGQPVLSGGSSGAVDGGSTPVEPLSNSDLLSAIDTAYNSGAGAVNTGVETGAGIATTAFDTGATDISGPFGDVISSLIDKGQTSPAVAKKTKVVKQEPGKFYTYKNQVPLKAGQSIGFTPGKGYYVKGEGRGPLISVPSPSAGGTAHKLTARQTTVQPKAREPKNASRQVKQSPNPATDTRTFHTFKNQVPLRKGQTVHFTPGKGYYAA